ncbi:hypothetical protein A1F94_007816 [Pyrenophora tritici-repentis]|uniref:Uncharacterized protein n=1 Tax=Pyrenophora tritici-repentis TaxID=45151 RepID=A0A5M9L0X2_9PLEO|nr:hypothetical protein PtrV1_10484 [Pyrenophora tritici-repentis]KAF7446464.1 hypothetical protein A1F99_097550 [Pyrenophora tritici-repentis]KAF7567579.1 hypothetical protein PtrM4_141700 [Pyrenophora tritici-repentis]KAG9382162.1 hypothetical protein A1F94_007816 [Pyrenophora tritici-repentis]
MDLVNVLGQYTQLSVLCAEHGYDAFMFGFARSTASLPLLGAGHRTATMSKSVATVLPPGQVKVQQVLALAKPSDIRVFPFAPTNRILILIVSLH